MMVLNLLLSKFKPQYSWHVNLAIFYLSTGGDYSGLFMGTEVLNQSQ